MRRSALVLLVLTLVILAVGCSREPLAPAAPAPQPSVSPAYAPESMASELVRGQNWLAEGESVAEGIPDQTQAAMRSPGQGLVYQFDREVIAGDIVHYSAMIRTGPGVYDRIGIHRVVRESRPHRPIRTPKALFMLHGDLKTFEGMFIPGQYSPNLPDDFGIAVHLARHGIDVWGIDQAWNFVPQGETDFSFFANWGIQKEAAHLATAIAVARLSRCITGNGLDKMLLLGYSSGCMTGYVLLDQETQKPECLRQVKGYIAADCGVRSDDPGWIENNLGWVAWYESLYGAGQYQDALITRDVSMLARTAPDDPSPFAPGFTNMQFALYLGGGAIWPPALAHYHAPVLQDGLPVGFQFVTIDQWLDFTENTAYYEPILFELEYNRMFAMLDSPYITHLGEITVPVLDVGGAGGIAPYTSATVGYLGSTDITQLYVSAGAPSQDLEYGHIDIFTAVNAPTLVWQPITDWVVAHSSHSAAEPKEPVEAGAIE